MLDTPSDTDHIVSVHSSVIAEFSAPLSATGDLLRRTHGQTRRENDQQARQHAKGDQAARRAGADARETWRGLRSPAGRACPAARPTGCAGMVRGTIKGPRRNALLISQEIAS